MDEKLKEIRKKIDAADDEIVKLFNRRMSLVKEVAAVKAVSSLPLAHNNREREILERVTANAQPEIRGFTVRLFETLFAVSKDYQNEILKTGENNVVRKEKG